MDPRKVGVINSTALTCHGPPHTPTKVLARRPCSQPGCWQEPAMTEHLSHLSHSLPLVMDFFLRKRPAEHWARSHWRTSPATRRRPRARPWKRRRRRAAYDSTPRREACAPLALPHGPSPLWTQPSPDLSLSLSATGEAHGKASHCFLASHRPAAAPRSP